MSNIDVEKVAQDGAHEVVELVQKNRKLGQAKLEKVHQDLVDSIEKIRDNMDSGEALWVKKNDRGDTVFSLENTLRDIEKGIGATLTSVESMNSLMDMIINDFGGTVYSLNQTQHALTEAGAKLETLLNLLDSKGVISEPEMMATFDEIVKIKTAEIEKQKEEEAAKATPSE